MKIKDIFKKLEGYDPETKVDLIAHDRGDRGEVAEMDELSIGEYMSGMSGRKKELCIELNMKIEEGVLLVSKMRWEEALDNEWKYKELCK